MADDRYDYYGNHPENRHGRDRDVYLDNRTGVGAEGRGYRATYDRDRGSAERDLGNQDYFRDHSGNRETRSFRPDRDGADRGYQTYLEGRDERSYNGSDQGYRNGSVRDAGQSFDRGDRYAPAYNAYPTYSAYSGNEVPYQYEGDPRRSGGYRADAYRNEVRGRDFWDRTGDTIASWFGSDEARRRHEADLRGDGHQGKGPKTYKRSDSRIQEDVNDRLTDDAWLDATHVDVKVQDAEVTLSGTVNSRDGRRHAERIAEHVSGVTHVQNNLRVDNKQTQEPASNTTGPTGMGGGDNVSNTLDKQARGDRH